MTKQKLPAQQVGQSIQSDRLKLAEEIAEKVLGWDRSANDCWNTTGSSAINIINIYGITQLTQIIFSPEGFFAVWDVVEKNCRSDEGGRLSILFSPCWPNDVADIVHIGNCRGEGKSRYEAFYKAVLEVMKDE